MKASCFFRLTTALGFAAFAATAAYAPARADDPAPQSAICTAPGELTRLVNPLKRMAQKVAGGQPVKIVAGRLVLNGRCGREFAGDVLSQSP